MPIQSGGGYQLDFENLDAIDPFQGSSKMVLSPVRPAVGDPCEVQQTAAEDALPEPGVEAALSDTLPCTSSVENSLADISSTESSVVVVNVAKVPAIEEEEDICTATADEKQPTEASACTGQQEASGSFSEDVPLPVKNAYNLDFDNLNTINPFQMGGSKIQNSPVVGRKVPDGDPPAEEKKPAETPKEEKVIPVPLDVKPTETAEASESDPADAPVQEGPIKLEFNFGDGSEVKRKPPPKRLGKRPTDAKRKEGKPPSDPKPTQAAAAAKAGPVDAADVPTPKASYSLDFDKFDDPYFNPFGTKMSITNSPKGSSAPSPVLSETAPAAQTEEPEKEEAAPSEK